MTVRKFVLMVTISINLSHQKNKIMKKLVFFSLSFVLFFISCRQEDELLSNEDATNLKIIQQSRSLRQKNDLIKNIKNDTILSTTRTVEMAVEEMAIVGVDGQIVPPPR